MLCVLSSEPAVGTVKDYSVGMSIMNLWTVFNNVLCIWIGRLTIVVFQASCCVANNTLIDDLSFRSFAFIKQNSCSLLKP